MSTQRAVEPRRLRNPALESARAALRPPKAHRGDVWQGGAAQGEPEADLLPGPPRRRANRASPGAAAGYARGMNGASSIRSAFPEWPRQAGRLRDAVAALTDAQLAIVPGPGRWPLWATVGHLACQRVFWLCDFAGEPGADGTPYPNAAHDCPGDDDLEHVLTARQLAEGLEASFAIVERVLDAWTPASLAREISHPEWGAGNRVHTRGFVIERVYAHDIAHIAELNEALTSAGLPIIDLWG